ncbi:rhomboid family intramembrane serine protease [Thalassobacillus devorans]|uniref:Rhomboid family intramembrane serine protease n=1 Tax=Thalassobacillus devorans TaxID=279813 RepID=A0ABQ1P5Z3_9BACI|nr:rhomboid family intramembrane serine protease [Thalassobacillus devorans]NIK29647.1 rhomboid protease GluP [Thalassobacillus devorans]GGC91730.1 rhomboid family intramembrane serine protease [Thalassobacillus devorans]
MFIEEEFYFWQLTHDLVVNQGFDILHVNEMTSEVWLEKQINRKNHIVRLYRSQFDWSNHIKKDIARINQHIQKNKHMFVGKEINVHAVYISEYSPVDEWDGLVRPLKVKGKKDMYLTVHYLDRAEREIKLGKLYEALQLAPLPQQPEPINTDIHELEAEVEHLKQEILFQRDKSRKEQEKLFDYGKPFMTRVLLVINIAVFLYIEMNGQSTSVMNLIEYGAKYNPAIIEGEWWRIVTSMFIHIGMLHLFMNMLALYYLGMAVEKIYGTVRFTFIYLLAGIFGGVTSFALNPQVAAGASGAIFGLFGALLFFGIKHKRIFFRTMGRNLLFIIGLNVVLGLSVPQIDNGAHMGGLAGGFIASAIVNLPKNRQPLWQIIAVAGYVAALISLALYGFIQADNQHHTAVDVEMSNSMLVENRFDESITYTTQALEKDGDYTSYLLFNRAVAYYETGEIDKAQSDLEQVVELEPDMAEAHYNLALIYRNKGVNENAIAHAKKAKDLRPSNEDFEDLYNQLNE